MSNRPILRNVRPDLTLTAGPVVNGLQAYTVTGRRVSGVVYVSTHVKRDRHRNDGDPELVVTVSFRRRNGEDGLTVSGVELAGYRDVSARPNFRYDRPSVNGRVPQEGLMWSGGDGYLTRAGLGASDPTNHMSAVAYDVALLAADAFVGDRLDELTASETLRDARNNVARALQDVRNATDKLRDARNALTALGDAGGNYVVGETSSALAYLSPDDVVRVRILGPEHSTKHLSLSVQSAHAVATIIAADHVVRNGGE